MVLIVIGRSPLAPPVCEPLTDGTKYSCRPFAGMLNRGTNWYKEKP
jgi:hypothetical protein